MTRFFTKIMVKGDRIFLGLFLSRFKANPKYRCVSWKKTPKQKVLSKSTGCNHPVVLRDDPDLTLPLLAGKPKAMRRTSAPSG